MASDLKYSTAARSAQMTALNTEIGASAILRIYDGTKPASVADAITGTLLAAFTCDATAFGSVSNGVLTAAAIASTTGESGAGAGTDATHFRLWQSDGTTAVIDGTVGETADSPDLVLDNKNIADGQTVSISSFVLTRGNA